MGVGLSFWLSSALTPALALCFSRHRCLTPLPQRSRECSAPLKVGRLVSRMVSFCGAAQDLIPESITDLATGRDDFFLPSPLRWASRTSDPRQHDAPGTSCRGRCCPMATPGRAHRAAAPSCAGSRLPPGYRNCLCGPCSVGIGLLLARVDRVKTEHTW